MKYKEGFINAVVLKELSLTRDYATEFVIWKYQNQPVLLPPRTMGQKRIYKIY